MKKKNGSGMNENKSVKRLMGYAFFFKARSGQRCQNAKVGVQLWRLGVQTTTMDPTVSPKLHF